MPYTFTSLLNGVPVESFTGMVGDTSFNKFFGFQNSAFGTTEAAQGGTGGVPYNLLNNLQIGSPVSKPSTFALLGLGGPGLAGWGRWGKRATV